jgi:hypothetical protein
MRAADDGSPCAVRISGLEERRRTTFLRQLQGLAVGVGRVLSKLVTTEHGPHHLGHGWSVQPHPGRMEAQCRRRVRVAKDPTDLVRQETSLQRQPRSRVPEVMEANLTKPGAGHDHGIDVRSVLLISKPCQQRRAYA